MSEIKFLFDMDGVLCDFIGAVCKALDIDRDKLFEQWPKGQWFIPLMNRYVVDDFEEMEILLWREIESVTDPEEFWRDMEPLSDGMELWDMVMEEFGPDSMMLCTTPSHHPTSLSGKLKWIQEHIGERWRSYALTPVKFTLAKKTRILIDDSDKNCDAFKKAGGQILLYPQHWNEGDENLSTAQLFAELVRKAEKKRRPDGGDW